MNKPTIFIVEDEPALAELLADYLRAAAFETRHFAEGDHVVESVKSQSPDLILLDLMLPGKDGTTICQEVRRFSSVPIIMVTAKVEEIDRLLGLELGADDYICKPYSPREVVARVKAVLRRAAAPPTSPPNAADGIHLDERRFVATFNGNVLELTPVEFRLLKALAEQPGRVFSRNQLLDILYTDHRVVSDRTVDSHVKNLRQKLQPYAPNQDVIRSIYGVGYKLELTD